MKRSAASIDPGWTIERVLDACPHATAVLLRRGMACVGCAMAPFETLTEATREYHLDLAEVLAELRVEHSRRGVGEGSRE